jgi:hypothetical protein
MSILDDLPDIFADALGDSVFYDAVLRVHSKGAGPAYNPGPSTFQDYPCKGLVTNWSNYSMASGLVTAMDRKILILASTCAVAPSEGCDIIINGGTYRLNSQGGSAPAVKRDPSASVWTCRGRA